MSYDSRTYMAYSDIRRSLIARFQDADSNYKRIVRCFFAYFGQYYSLFQWLK